MLELSYNQKKLHLKKLVKLDCKTYLADYYTKSKYFLHKVVIGGGVQSPNIPRICNFLRIQWEFHKLCHVKLKHTHIRICSMKSQFPNSVCITLLYSDRICSGEAFDTKLLHSSSEGRVCPAKLSLRHHESRETLSYFHFIGSLQLRKGPSRRVLTQHLSI